MIEVRYWKGCRRWAVLEKDGERYKFLVVFSSFVAAEQYASLEAGERGLLTIRREG